MRATTKDLRLHTSSLLAAVDRGESVVITYRGKCRAVLAPWHQTESESAAEHARNPAFGLWADQEDDVDDAVRALREPRPLP